jgi:5-methyltetrahydrofolate--homocysteine methyltransferase
MDALAGLLATKPVLLADGAMGTSLFALGLETGGSPELWNLEQPDHVRAVHQGFIDAGSDIVLTNSFGANRMRLALHGAQDRVAELNRAAARLAREPADAAGREVLVAGAMGPTGEIFAPVGGFSADDGVAAFAEQAQGLADGGVNLLWIETISSVEELTAAVSGAAGCGLPIVATMTFDTRGRTMMGLTCEAAMGLRAGLAVPPVAFGANCGIGPAQLVDSVLGLMGAAEPGDLIVAKGNCGLPHYHDGEIRYDGTPEIMADYACLARDAGARIIGGCCGTTPTHIAAMALALATRPARPAPDLATVEQTLGPIAAEAAAPRPRTRRRDAG